MSEESLEEHLSERDIAREEFEDKLLERKSEIEPVSCSLGVGDGTGQHFVNGDYDTIKLLQDKLFHYEKLKQGLHDAIDVLNQIENTYIPSMNKRTYVIIPTLEKILRNEA